MADNSSLPTLIFLLLLLSTPPPAESFSYGQWRTLFSVAHSLMKRVANLRASRGDFSGSERARRIAEKLERGLGLGFWRGMWSMGWDYMRNYAWRDMAASSREMLGAVSDLNELLRALNELTRIESGVDKAAWVRNKYQNVLRISESLFRRLLQVFGQSGALREVVLTLQREVVEGGLLKDCLELGSNDLKGLIQVIKDLALQFSSSSDRDDL
ncbi:hypothetical protein HHK36_005228 [Tetracentron sinense]|uniref:Uncharacterized protein n=1 Tax=Tetracentron sinense TaxID=13715 RepID=A0A834ZNZ8_TETSI|nr:hypothetical protein HHK36_005228 [Tetracentron sinense]